MKQFLKGVGAGFVGIALFVALLFAYLWYA